MSSGPIPPDPSHRVENTGELTPMYQRWDMLSRLPGDLNAVLSAGAKSFNKSLILQEEESGLAVRT